MHYTITGMGWGSGHTADEAETAYLEVQRRSFSHLSDGELLGIAWGYTWRAPEGATGFRNTPDGHLWIMGDDDDNEGSTAATPDQRVRTFGGWPATMIGG